MHHLAQNPFLAWHTCPGRPRSTECIHTKLRCEVYIDAVRVEQSASRDKSEADGSLHHCCKSGGGLTCTGALPRRPHEPSGGHLAAAGSSPADSTAPCHFTQSGHLGQGPCMDDRDGKLLYAQHCMIDSPRQRLWRIDEAHMVTVCNRLSADSRGTPPPLLPIHMTC